jgi:hypothetical protein
MAISFIHGLYHHVLLELFLHDLHSRQVQAAVTFEQFYRPCGSLKIEGAMHAAEADQQNFGNLVSFTEKKGCSYTQPQK